jgi:hypothetical protein
MDLEEDGSSSWIHGLPRNSYAWVLGNCSSSRYISKILSMSLDHRDRNRIVFTLLAIALVFGVVRSNLHMTFFGVVRNPQEVLATLNAPHDEVSSPPAAAAPAGRSSSSSLVFDNNATEPSSSRTDSQAFNISGCRREPVVAPLKNNASEGLDHHPHHVFQYMSATYNNMTDDELLWMATRISVRSRGAPPKQHTPARIAFMFLIRGPLPFARLWERYFFGHERLYSVYVHANPSFVPDDVPLSSPFSGGLWVVVVDDDELLVFRR